MADGTGPAPKKETVYGGSPGVDNKAFTKPPVPGTVGTVYSGPTPGQATEGTVYSGPDPQGTVFDERRFVAKKVDASVAIKATTRRVRATAIAFFIVAGISLLEAVLYWSSDPLYAISSAIVFVLFLVIGIFTFRLSRVALLTAIVIYLLDTLALLWQAFTTEGGLVTNLLFIGLHLYILYRLWLTLGQLHEMHTL